MRYRIELSDGESCKGCEFLGIRAISSGACYEFRLPDLTHFFIRARDVDSGSVVITDSDGNRMDLQAELP